MSSNYFYYKSAFVHISPTGSIIYILGDPQRPRMPEGVETELTDPEQIKMFIELLLVK